MPSAEEIEDESRDAQAERERARELEDETRAQAGNEVLLVVAVKTNQPNIARRLKIILAAAQSVDGEGYAEVTARSADEVDADDVDALVQLFGPEATDRLHTPIP